MSFLKFFAKKKLNPELKGKDSLLNTYMVSDFLFIFAVPVVGLVLFREQFSNFFSKFVSRKIPEENKEMNAEVFKGSISNKIKSLKETKS